MGIWRFLSSAANSIRGGYRTFGPAASGPAAFDSRTDLNPTPSVNAAIAMNLSAVHGCVTRRAEARGTLPIHVRDSNKNVLEKHPIHRLLHDSPNAMQTPADFFTMASAHQDMFGNFLAIIHRLGDEIVSLEPILDPTECALVQSTKRMSNIKYDIGGDKFSPDDILHLRGFSLDGLWGLPRIDIGRKIIAAQLEADASAMVTFQQGLKVGGFFKNLVGDMDKPKAAEWKALLDKYAQPENQGKWLTLPKGLEPVEGKQFRITSADAELLASRHFGIEEICRLFNVPPQLIGHSDKASSWASSLEQINLFFLIYSLNPSNVRDEQMMMKRLLSDRDKSKGVGIKYQIQGLLRGDMKTQLMMFASALQNGYYNVNGVLDLLDRPGIGPEGDIYHVQMNMAQAGDKLPVANE